MGIGIRSRCRLSSYSLQNVKLNDKYICLKIIEVLMKYMKHDLDELELKIFINRFYEFLKQKTSGQNIMMIGKINPFDDIVLNKQWKQKLRHLFARYNLDQNQIWFLSLIKVSKTFCITEFIS